MYDLISDLNFPTFSRPGICDGHEDPDLWHSATLIEREEAKRICGLCPARDECLQWAIDNDEPLGIWGGMSAFQRRAFKKGIAA